jgi:hypothetical protein
MPAHRRPDLHPGQHHPLSLSPGPRRTPEGGPKARLSRLRPGEQFTYTFDLGDNWQHLRTVAPQRADPLETLGSSRSGRCRAGWLTSRQSCPGGDPGGHGQLRHLLAAARSATAT